MNGIRNPHFDDGRVIWNDDYSGIYQPVNYDEQFDLEWRLFLEKKTGFFNHTGVETSDPWIEDRIYELTGFDGFFSRQSVSNTQYRSLKISRWLNRFALALQGRKDPRDIGGRLKLKPKFPLDFFKGKRCLDVGCGAGRWTKTLITLGGKVKSVDVSKHGLQSTRQFNDDVEYLNLFDILEHRPDLHRAFDFTICWGVIMCTHNPKLGFENIAKTVKKGGKLYTMIYAPTYHNSPKVLSHREYYYRNTTTMDEKLEYAYKICDIPENAINWLDMLNTFYNWTVPESVIHNWYKCNGFKNIITLNAAERNNCAYHITGEKI